MNTYLRIVNNGLIEVEDLTLIGSSTKRGVAGKIGEFGSGNKFSLAWYFRNEAVPVIFRGLDKVNIDTKVVLHRDTPVQVITVNDVNTSITTNMGPKWTGWMALRETISNAIDEGGFEMNTMFNPTMVGEENKTIYYIPVTNELDKVVSNFNHYFSMQRVPIFTNELGEIFPRVSDNFNVYRQGIRCWDTNKEVNFDVNLFSIDINESRLIDETDFDIAVQKLFVRGVSKDIMHLFLTSKYKDIIPSTFSENNLEVIKDMVADGKTFGSSTMSDLAGLMGTSSFDYIIHYTLYNQLVRLKIIEGIDTYDQKKYVETDEVSEKLGEMKYFLRAFGLTNDVQCVITNSFSACEWEDGRILVNIKAFAENSIWSNKELVRNCLRTIPASVVEKILD